MFGAITTWHWWIGTPAVEVYYAPFSSANYILQPHSSSFIEDEILEQVSENRTRFYNYSSIVDSVYEALG